MSYPHSMGGALAKEGMLDMQATMLDEGDNCDVLGKSRKQMKVQKPHRKDMRITRTHCT